MSHLFLCDFKTNGKLSTIIFGKNKHNSVTDCFFFDKSPEKWENKYLKEATLYSR